MKVFIDANVFLEVFLQREKHEEAAALLKADAHRLQLFTSASVIGFIAYWLIKETGLLKTKSLLLQLTDFIRVVDISHEQLQEALQSNFKDVEDSLQYFTALQHGLDYLATFNKKDFRIIKGSVQVASPQEILRLMK